MRDLDRPVDALDRRQPAQKRQVLPRCGWKEYRSTGSPWYTVAFQFANPSGARCAFEIETSGVSQ
jgi:hypothetical protein